MSKRAQQKQQRLDDRFWKQTWPTLKANGWSVDARDGAFYPPQAQKMHAAKRRRLGSEHKNCFKNIHELTIYLSSNPVLYVGESKSTSGRESAGKGKFTKSRGKFAPQTSVIMTKTCDAKDGVSMAQNKDSTTKDNFKTSKSQAEEKLADFFSRSPSSVAASPAMASTIEFINQNKSGRKINDANFDGPSLALPPSATQKLENTIGVKKKKAKKLTEKKKTKKLTLRGPSKDFRKSANMEMKTKKKIKQKVKKKKNWRRTVNKNPRIFMCDRCGRDDFTNGHALGGHKKYCQKPQYDEAREKKLKRSRKRSRLDPKANSAINRSMSKAKSKVRKPLLDLNGITKKIRKFAENTNSTLLDKHVCHKSKNEGGDLDILDHVIQTKDLFELEVVQQVLREEKARLSGRIAGLNEDEPILSFDFADDGENNNSKLGSQIVGDESSIDASRTGQSGLWRDGTMALRRIKSYDYDDASIASENVYARKTHFGDVDAFISTKFSDKQKLDSDYECSVEPMGIQEEKSQADEDMFFACNDVFLNPSRQVSFNFEQDYADEGFEDSLGGDIAMQLGF